jgi:cytochrome c
MAANFSGYLPALLALAACSSNPQPSPSSTPPPAMSSAGTNASGSANIGGGGAGIAAGGSAAGAAATAGAGAAGAGGGGAAATAGSAGSAGTGGQPPLEGPFQVLAFTKTTGFRHDSIPAGLELLNQLGVEHDFTVTNSEDSADFTDENLAQYAVVVFMNASGDDLLDDTQQGAFERFIQAGGGYVGVHCASCGEDAWAWYGDLVGARFSGHPAIQEVTINVENHAHPSTAELPDVWVRDEEPYNFEMNPRANVTVLATFDEASYDGGSMGADHPIAWYHEFQGGRSWYTGLGHISEGYMEENFIKLVSGGVLWAAGRTP